ncbi:MAG: recombinase family protein [Planctomycetota bacterium]|nr:recombinase family protein [Planctomycetota bacterium]
MTKPTVRCAVYTRKSTEEGLDQDFNSLDAQRESAEAFIASQKNEGWVCLPDKYDDGGYTGGNMDRPAVKRLLADVEAGKVDCIVVYKVDRLSRSLLDFSRIIETLDRHNVSFVSVTQQFNTATSMGRLVLNVLLSFAQFEREIIAERTRDKMSAARRKGKWTGGRPMLGYDVDPKGGRLLVNEDEATRVRAIFDLYLGQQTLIPTVRELDRRGWTNKRWMTKKGHEQGGARFTKSSLFGILTNMIYVGKVNYRGQVYEGEHPAIVNADTWDRTQVLLRRNGRSGNNLLRNKCGATLRGLLYCGPCNAAMVHSYTTKQNKLYRYYVCTGAQKHGWDACPTKSVPAAEIERFVVDQIRRVGKDPGLVAETLRETWRQSQESIDALETERRVLERELKRSNAEVRRLAPQAAGSGDTAATARLADLQDRIRVAEQRATEIREEALALTRGRVNERELAAALSEFDPVWDSLAPRERTRVVQLLVQRVSYDGGKGTVAVTFHPAGIKTLAEERASRKEVCV